MSVESQVEREEAEIYAADERGEISSAECNREIRELWADYRAMAQESAQEAYEQELDRW